MKQVFLSIILLCAVLGVSAQKKPSQWNDATATSVKTRIGAINKTEGDSMYLQVANGDTAAYYTTPEVNALLKEARKDELLNALQEQGSNVLSLPAAATNLWYGSQIMTDSRPYQATHIIHDTITVTGVSWDMLTQGNYNADNYNGFFLCSVSGTTLTVIASTADDATIWKKAAGTYSTKAFTAPIVLNPGTYKLFGVYNTSDASPVAVPAFYTGQGGGNSAQYSQMLTNGHKFEGYITGTITAVPVASFESSAITAFPVCPSFLLY